MKKLLTPLIIGVLALFAAEWISKNLAPADATAAEADAYRYGGAALGAWIATSFVVKQLT